MGAVDAVEFKKRYGSIQVLLQQKKEVGQVAVLQKERLIFYIVTKEKSYLKPTLANFSNAIDSLYNEMFTKEMFVN